jgi:hypothetical protein
MIGQGDGGKMKNPIFCKEINVLIFRDLHENISHLKIKNENVHVFQSQVSISRE